MQKGTDIITMKDMGKDRKVTITCTERQLAMLEMICDRYARLIQGQLDISLQEVCEEAWAKRHKTEEHPHGIGSPEWYDMRQNLEERLKEMEKDYWGLDGGSYNGIGYDDYVDTIWDMHLVMRHARYLAMPKEEQERMRCTVMAYKAMRVGNQPLIEVRYEED